jgi:hypothetical protein
MELILVICATGIGIFWRNILHMEGASVFIREGTPILTNELKRLPEEYDLWHEQALCESEHKKVNAFCTQIHPPGRRIPYIF